jgi:hypothetical protein
MNFKRPFPPLNIQILPEDEQRKIKPEPIQLLVQEKKTETGISGPLSAGNGNYIKSAALHERIKDTSQFMKTALLYV